MRDELERLRCAHANVLDDLGLCQGEVKQLGKKCDALDLRLSASRRLARSYIGLWRRTLAESDELRRRLDIAHRLHCAGDTNGDDVLEVVE